MIRSNLIFACWNKVLPDVSKSALKMGIIAALVLAAGCSDSDVVNDADDGVSDDGAGFSTGPASRAITATRSPDFTAGQLERISITAGDTYDGSYNATLSDIFVTADATHVYEIGRFNIDSVTKLDPDNLDSLIYQRSVAGDDVSANPYEIVFADVTTAFLIRYGSDKVWIIDPSAATEEDFKTGELDLSAYNDGEIPPRASDGVLIGNKLFVLMERLGESFVPVKQGYIAVFDTTTGEEIDTGMGGADGLKGIPLGVNNPSALQAPADGGLLYALGRGNYFGQDDSAGDRYSGGVVSIDPETYNVTMLLDDGDEQSATETGFFVDLLVINETQAYLVTRLSFGDETLLKLDPSNPVLESTAVAELSGLPITTLAKGPKDRLWVGLDIPEAPGFRLLNLSDDSVARERVPTTLVPINVVFVDTTGELVEP